MRVQEAREDMNNEQAYFDVLQRIAKHYSTSDQLRRDSQRAYGLDYGEALEMAYDNIQAEASHAIRGKKRPKE